MPECYYCDHDVAHSAAFCPNCGAVDPADVPLANSPSTPETFFDRVFDFVLHVVFFPVDYPWRFWGGLIVVVILIGIFETLGV
jgi:hypothetical protein